MLIPAGTCPTGCPRRPVRSTCCCSSAGPSRRCSTAAGPLPRSRPSDPERHHPNRTMRGRRGRPTVGPTAGPERTSDMCRWLAYSGSPILLRDALYAPAHSLIEQSLHSRLGAEATNGDGFGVGWYGAGEMPAVFREIAPAWNDANLHEVAGHVTSPLFLAHIRASSGTAVQRTNCHPFRHGGWLFMHNGLINDFPAVKRDLLLDVDPALFCSIEGQTDSELVFHLALTLGLEDDPPAAVAGAVGLVEAAGRRRGVEHPFQGTMLTTDGERMWGFRYSSAGRSRSLFVTTDVSTLRRLY